MGEYNVLIKDSHCLVETNNSVCSCVFERLKAKIDCLPVLLHFCHACFDVVLLSSSLTTFNDLFCVLQKLHVHAFLEGKALVWFNWLAERLGQFCPVSIFDSFCSQSHYYWNLRSKIFNIILQIVCNFEDIGQFFVSEKSDGLSQCLFGIVNCFFNIGGIDFIKWTI